MVLVKAETKTRNADEMVQFSNQVETSMAGNTNFTDPTPKVSDLTDARQALQAAIGPAAHGDRVAVARRNSLTRALSDLLVAMSQYVNSASMGDRDVALTSGFPPAKTPEPTPLVDPPYSVTAEATEKAGEARIRYRTHKGSKTKQIYATTGDPNLEEGWELVGVTTKSSFLAINLDPSKFYWFKVNAVCAAGVSGYSDPAKVRAAA